MTQAFSDAELERDLRNAFKNRELQLHYQPQVDLRSGCINGAEALLRWRRQDGTFVPAGEFIPMAELSELIVHIGSWVIDEVCRQKREWLDAGLPEMKTAVNISARQFRSGNLIASVANALRRHGLSPKSLELELTESMLVEQPEEACAVLAQLRKLGVKLSLDDFGTGYSSLSYLSIFPINSLKIDRSFVHEIVSDPRSAIIVTSIICLAHRLRLRVIAEGVETEGQMGYLKKNGCDDIQGYLFSKPVPVKEFTQLLRQPLKLSGLGRTSFEEERTLLIVDDEPHILSAIRRALHWDGYQILTADSAQEALDLLARHSIQVILADVRMPKMSGIELLGRVKGLHPGTVRMILTGYAELKSVIDSVNEGSIYKFLTKPWKDDHLREQILDAFHYYEAIVRPGLPYSSLRAIQF